jgi:hypothetical protein
MNPLPPHLASLLTKITNETQWVGPLQCDGFNKGFLACYQALLERGAGELNEIEIEYAADECECFNGGENQLKPKSCFVKGARFQRSQDCAVIAAEQAKVKELEYRLCLADEGFKTVLDENKRIAELEASLDRAHNEYLDAEHGKDNR